MKLFGDYAALKPNVLCIKCKHALPVTVASHRQRFTRTSILLTSQQPASLPPPTLHWPWACNRFVAAATNITMPLQQVSQRASQRDLWYIFSASQGSPACLPALLPACLACLLVKFIKYLCGSCLHSFHLAFTYSLSLSLLPSSFRLFSPVCLQCTAKLLACLIHKKLLAHIFITHTQPHESVLCVCVVMFYFFNMHFA